MKKNSKIDKLVPYLRAEVRDISRGKVSIDDKILVDTNVLYFCYYDKFDQLDILEEGVLSYQTRVYPPFLKKLLSSGVTLLVHKFELIEFTNLVETAELQILYCKESGDTKIGEDFSIKALRRDYPEEYHSIQRKLATYLNSIRKAFRLINSVKSIDEVLTNFLIEWQDSLGDPCDALMISEAKKEGVYSFLSDDSDFATFKDINLYTANKTAIEAYKKHSRRKSKHNRPSN